MKSVILKAKNLLSRAGYQLKVISKHLSVLCLEADALDHLQGQLPLQRPHQGCQEGADRKQGN